MSSSQQHNRERLWYTTEANSYMRFPFTFTKLYSNEYHYFMKYFSLVINSAKYGQLLFHEESVKVI
jgi:hypothetical protein